MTEDNKKEKSAPSIVEFDDKAEAPGTQEAKVEKTDSSVSTLEVKEPVKEKSPRSVSQEKGDGTLIEQNNKPVQSVKAKTETRASINLNGLFAFKMSMSTFYNETGENFPVTALKYEPCSISQIKTKEKEAYSAVQVAFKPQKNKRCSKALIKHLAPAGFKEGACFVREIRQIPPEGVELGQTVSIESLKKGDLVKISALSKGRGFTGVMKRWNFAGGKSSHGSKTHRRTGSIGQHTEPARVFPGRKMPGQHGFQKVSRSKVPIVEVLAEEGIIFVKGPVPGAKNTLVSIQKI